MGPLDPAILSDRDIHAAALGHEPRERRIFTDILQPSYGGVTAFGDDCAVVDGGMVVTTDSCPTPLLDQLGEKDPYAAGWLLATINLSDLAAAGAEPVGLVVKYTLPPDTPVDELQEIIRGIGAHIDWMRTQSQNTGPAWSPARQVSRSGSTVLLPRR